MFNIDYVERLVSDVVDLVVSASNEEKITNALKNNGHYSLNELSNVTGIYVGNVMISVSNLEKEGKLKENDKGEYFLISSSNK